MDGDDKEQESSTSSSSTPSSPSSNLRGRRRKSSPARQSDLELLNYREGGFQSWAHVRALTYSLTHLLTYLLTHLLTHLHCPSYTIAHACPPIFIFLHYRARTLSPSHTRWNTRHP